MSPVFPNSPSAMDLSKEEAIKAALDGDAKAAFLVEAMAQSGEIDDATRDRVREVHPDGPRPDPGVMAEMKAVEILQAHNALDATALAVTRRKRLAENPELIAELICLAKAGARTAYAMLKNLSESGLLESAEKVAFGELPEPAEGETNDAPPIPIVHKPQALPAIPVPLQLSAYVNAVVELSGCSLATAHCVIMGSINLAIANDLDVESLAPDVHPSSLFLMTSARTGWRKSSAFGLAFRAHREADDAIHSRWEEARKAKKASKPSAESTSSSAEPVSFLPADLVDSEPADRPKEVSPIALRDDTTAEAMMLNLAQGRRTQSLASAEAGVLLGGWSFGKAQAGQTLSKLSALWSGETVDYERVTGRVSIRVGDVRLTSCLLSQPSFVTENLLSEAAVNGFSARTLISRDINRPTPMTFEWPAGTSARFYVNRLNELITRVRQGQDVGAEYADTIPSTPTAMRPTPEAKAALREFLSECQSAADLDPGEHELGFLERAAEQGGRYAATVAAFRSLDAGEPFGETYSETDVKDAVEVIRWFAKSLASFSEDAADTRLVRAANWAAGRLKEWAMKYDGKVPLLSCLGNFAAGDGKFLKNDPDAKRRVIALLEEYDHVTALGRGSYKVNPLEVRKEAETGKIGPD